MSEQLSTNFWRSEFACHCGTGHRGGCGFDGIDPNLVRKLQILRDEIGAPIAITSGCRCVDYNNKIGGSPGSSHLLGFAVDIYCHSSAGRMKIIKAALPLFKRIGIAGNFIHLDIDESKTQELCWVYS